MKIAELMESQWVSLDLSLYNQQSMWGSAELLFMLQSCEQIIWPKFIMLNQVDLYKLYCHWHERFGGIVR